MLSGSHLLGAKRGQAHFLSHPSLSILLFHNTKWSVNEIKKSCQSQESPALKMKGTKKSQVPLPLVSGQMMGLLCFPRFMCWGLDRTGQTLALYTLSVYKYEEVSALI